MPQLPSIPNETLPFVLHFFLTIFVAIAVLFLTDRTDTNQTYYLNQRRPHFIDISGSPRVASIQNAKLLQSDITTMLSLAASATRAAAAWWAGKLLWRCAFMFMEKSEITLAGFSKVISGGITTLLSPHHVFSRKNWLLVYIIISICFGMDYFSAILTGSITWQPAVTLVDGVVPLMNITGPIFDEGAVWYYRNDPQVFMDVIESATSLDLVSWGFIDVAKLPEQSGFIRRPITVGGIHSLPPNSTIRSIQLPYFKVEKFEYIRDPESTLTSQQLSLLNDTSPYNSFQFGGGGLLPDASWGPGSSTILPPPTIISESRILGMVFFSNSSCNLPPDSAVPQGVNSYRTYIIGLDGYQCIIFANVTYTAGAAICRNCKVVSPPVVQDQISNLQPIPDALAIEALAITSMVWMHISINVYHLDPQPNGPVTHSLQTTATVGISRAYQCAWSSLMTELSSWISDNHTSIMIAVPASHPIVLQGRVYLWAVLHLTVLLGGITFVYFQSRLRHPWFANPAMAAFLLDTTQIFEKGEVADAMDPLRPDAKYPAGRLKLNDYDPNRPGQPRTVVLVPTLTTPSRPQELEGESDVLLTQLG